MSDTQQPTPSIPDSAPWWAKGILAVGHAFGVSAILLAFYLGQSAGVIPNPVEERLEKIEAGMQQDAGHAIRHDTTMQEMVKAVQEQTRHLEESAKQRQMWCVMKAKTDDEKKACFPAVAK